LKQPVVFAVKEPAKKGTFAHFGLRMHEYGRRSAGMDSAFWAGMLPASVRLVPTRGGHLRGRITTIPISASAVVLLTTVAGHERCTDEGLE